MTKLNSSNIIILLLLALLLFILGNPTFVIEEISSALFLFITKYFPAVFSIYIITDLLINYHFPEKLARVGEKIWKKVFHTDSICCFIVIMSMISGFPSGAKYIKELLDKEILTTEHANYLITFTHFSNPLFILGTCFLITKSRALTLCILISHFISNFIIAIITRPKEIPKSQRRIKSFQSETFPSALTTSIYKTFKLMFLVLGTSTIFFVLSGIITSPIKSPTLKYLITGVLDLTKGISMIPNTLPLLGKGIAILLFLGFGSFSVHMQVLSIIKDTKVYYRNFLLGRISQVAISILLFFLCHFLKLI